jgi:hypothetical protein
VSIPGASPRPSTKHVAIVVAAVLVLCLGLVLARSAVAQRSDTWGFPVVAGTELSLVTDLSGSDLGCTLDIRILAFKDRTGRSGKELEDALWPAMLEAGWVPTDSGTLEWLSGDGTIRARILVTEMAADESPGAGKVSAVDAKLKRVDTFVGPCVV